MHCPGQEACSFPPGLRALFGASIIAFPSAFKVICICYALKLSTDVLALLIVNSTIKNIMVEVAS